MTEREALKLALEALEYPLNQSHENFNVDVAELLAHRAITAIKEALAQQCVCGEPDSAGTHRTDGPCLAPQRTWVGLTDDEIDQGLLRSDYTFKTAKAWRAGVVFAMTKLKEKNT